MVATGRRPQLVALGEAIPSLALGKCKQKPALGADTLSLEAVSYVEKGKKKKKKDFTAHLLLYLR